MTLRIGTGFDLHPLVKGRRLILGGVEIPYSLGLLGHSDADVLLHAICDAFLGALALGDIGHWFPDNDPQYKDADSQQLLLSIIKDPKVAGWRIVNLDATILAEKPKLAPFLLDIRQKISHLLQTPLDAVSVKATTMEKLGPIGEGKAMATQVVILLEKEISL